MLFENSLDGIMLTAPDGRILDANPSACHMLGRSRDEIIQGGRAGVIDVSDPFFRGCLKNAHGKDSRRGPAKRNDGSIFPIDISSVVFRDGEGNARTCIILRDVSRRKAAESERDRLIAELQDALKRVKLPVDCCRFALPAKKYEIPRETGNTSSFTSGITPMPSSRTAFVRSAAKGFTPENKL